ncbi:histidine phosphatase superfamily [Desulfoluna spongiiphila]|nr:histidine phosphatase superfamily [Desulfoluna spongiiphila]
MIYLMRHGEIETSGEKRYVGQKDLPLSRRGISQAKAWSARLKDIPFDRILCSGLSRTLETARIIAGSRPLPVESLAGFREINLGTWDGELMATIKKREPEAWHQRGDNLAGFRPPGGESFADLQERALPLLNRVASSARGNVLVVAHAGVNRAMLCGILGMPLGNLFSIAQDYACLNLLRYKNTWTVKAMNLTMP